MVVLPLMVLSVPEAMAELEDVTLPEMDESSAPESWEMVDLEENMKKLLASSQVAAMSASQGSLEQACIVNESNGGSLPFHTDSLDAARGPDQVDGFLKEALQNPRDRLTSKALVSHLCWVFPLGSCWVWLSWRCLPIYRCLLAARLSLFGVRERSSK